MNQTTTEILITKLTKAITFKYKEDKTAPGLTVAALKQGFYCSIVRYDGAFARSKVVLCKSRANTLDECLKDLAKQFLKLTDRPKDPVQELQDAVGT